MFSAVGPTDASAHKEMKSTNNRFNAQKSAPPLTASELAGLIETGRAAFARYESEEALDSFQAALSSRLLSEEQRATLCCLAAEALENLARYHEAIEILTEYEKTDTRAALHPVVLGKVYLRLGSAYGYASDRPRAISYARNALALAEERDDISETGNCHQVLGRIYRAIGETKIARDHFQQALKHHRLTGNKTAIAYAYHGLAMVEISEGSFKSAQDYHDQALKLLDENGPPLLFGHIYINSAAVMLLQEQGQEKVVELLQRAAHYFERSRNKRLLAAAYTNLGYNLLHLGETPRARQALEAAIRLAREIGERVAQGNSLETLGELAMMCGQFEEAERLAREGIAVLQEVSGRWVESQACLTLGRCYLLQNRCAEAAEAFTHSLSVADKTDDQRGQVAARLWLIETQLEAGETAAARKRLTEVSSAVEKLANTLLIGHLRELSGRLAAAEGQYSEAAGLLGQAVSIFEMVSNSYRTGTARYHLGLALAQAGETAKARAELEKAQNIFTRLEAAPMLARTSLALEHCGTLARGLNSPQPTREQTIDFAVASNAALLRLAGAASSRDLLLHELSQIISQDLSVAPVIVYEFSDSTAFPLTWCGCDQSQAAALAESVRQARAAGSSAVSGAALYELRSGGSAALTLYVGNCARALHPHRQFIEPLVRLSELCLELCALRNQVRTIAGYDLSAEKKEIELPGLVYRSAAMRVLIDEINRIRSSSVTVLVTGESGTGKEVIARAIHTLSDRRDAPFVAFNCTVAPREIIDSQLFGHRKGAFTGANNDYDGVIRSAAGGTLFLDEVGDLALEVQPKLLRFLQEGEIQPLGATKPVKVSVRVIAATNCDLEKLVAEGKFREDLYYRLNVIRLHMPPLRDRRDEIPALITHLIARYSEQEGKQNITIKPQALDLMMIYDWPGNVRQLANEIQRLIALTPAGGEITEEQLSPLIRHSASAGSSKSSPPSYYSGALNGAPAEPSIESLLSREALTARAQPAAPAPAAATAFEPAPGQKLSEAVSELETRLLRSAIARHRGNLRAVARELGLSPRGLYLKLERYGIGVKRE